ncbi:MAG: SAM-dependent methyltransferase [Bacteroidetes bacterium]|nr:SAM-dependent methyltransferase [Bacteroidota bacterium]
MPHWLHDLATAAHRAAFQRRLRRVCASAAPDDSPLHAALAATCQNDAPEWAAWSDRIEALRTMLRRSPAQVTFDDFGAGSRWREAGPRRVTRDVRHLVRASVPLHEAWLLYHLVRHLRPRSGLELGTCLGLSAAYVGAALHDNARDGHDAGRFVTLEGGAALARLARRHLDALDLSSHARVVTGRFQDTLPGVLARHAPIDFAFIDGHHDPEATLTYVDQIAPHLADGALLVFDDIAWSVGMRRAWRALRDDPRLPETVDLWTVGLGWYASVP